MVAAGLKANPAVSGSPSPGSSDTSGEMQPASSLSAGHRECWHCRSTHTGQQGWYPQIPLLHPISGPEGWEFAQTAEHVDLP